MMSYLRTITRVACGELFMLLTITTSKILLRRCYPTRGIMDQHIQKVSSIYLHSFLFFYPLCLVGILAFLFKMEFA
ncbi:hypothetical protein RHGRI_021725 [Rhododendron griersonianum]|uniref:Uncharacterized protein n=1 Tax=Rhododendron griersonianum TaxID=479676 RepID=A0AAV6JMN1_9ERIC|nr:hypothetical protein RHGRI_021725 [Rhododendron griersonianum]